VRLNATRKNFAVTGEKESVCCGAPPSGSFTISRKACPSSLASRDFSGFEIPATIAVIKSTLLVTIEMERIVCG
jgi:hypothetical protein